jgi:hypothetical protein
MQASKKTSKPQSRKTTKPDGDAKQSKVRSASQAQDGAANSSDKPSDAVTLLKSDHRKVEQLFAQYETLQSEQEKRATAQEICKELINHTRLEEEIFYPACREQGVEDDLLDEAQVEHDSAKILIGELLNGQPGGNYYDAKVAVLREQIKHHVREEEQPTSGIFAKATAAGMDMNELGQKVQARKQELLAEGGSTRAPRPVSLQLAFGDNTQENQTMASQYRQDRDEQGRFESDDDRGGRGSSRQSRSRDDDRSDGRSRDDNGRFESQGRDGNGGRSARSRDDDDNGRGRGGWFGDPRGHSEASREGWENRDGGNRSSRSRNDDDSRSSRSRDDDDDNRGRGRGWFGDSRGHSEASREGWENRDGGNRSSRSRNDDDSRSSRSRDDGDDDRGRGRGGWFGDSRGHSEASREGWENRDGGSRSSRSRNDDDSRSSRSRDDDDNRGRGWFGDSRGHSEASREGWENRDGGNRSSRSRDDDSRNSRSRNDDDDRGHGGWFGDSRGHAEAARRGWQNR